MVGLINQIKFRTMKKLLIILPLLVACKSNKSGCDAYSNTSYKYCIDGYVTYNNDTVKATAYVNEYKYTKDSIYYMNSNGTSQTLIAPYTIHTTK